MSKSPSDHQPVVNLTLDERNQIKNHGRWLRRVCQPFHSFESILSVWLNSQEGSQRLAQQNTREHYTALTNVQRTFRIEDADTIIAHLPFIRDRIALPTTTAEEIVAIARKAWPMVQKKAGGGKDTDCKNMKSDLITLILPECLPDSGSAHVEYRNPGMHKAWRGFNSPVTARLLCPANHFDKMKTDPEGTQESLNAGTLPMRDKENQPFLPAFLYDEKMMDGSLTKGLFRGPLLLKAYRYIFLGRSHADGAAAKTKGGNAYIHGMISAKPSSICYAAIQVYVALSAMEKWGMVDDNTGMNLSTLYDLLREQFQDPNDPWCKETLKWWNDQVFADTSNEGNDQDIRDMEGPSMRERMAHERAAQMAPGGPPATNS